MRSEAQKKQSNRYGVEFRIRHGAIRPARIPHPDDLKIAMQRRKAEEAQEDRRMKLELKEVWE